MTTVEPATLGDVGTVTDLWVDLASSQQAFGSDLLAEGNRDAVREALARQAVAGGLLVAREDDIVGFVAFEPEGGRYEKRVETGVVQNIFVVPERRCEGIGSALLREAERRLREDGAEAITLEAMAKNDRAVAFYERHGYELHRLAMRKSDSDSSQE